MVLAKNNNTSSSILAEVLKKHLLLNFKEFKGIEIAKPGFLNIYFDITFWENYLLKLIRLNSKFGINANPKKNILARIYLKTMKKKE